MAREVFERTSIMTEEMSTREAKSEFESEIHLIVFPQNRIARRAHLHVTSVADRI
jgi:hypothetical protein